MLEVLHAFIKQHPAVTIVLLVLVIISMVELIMLLRSSLNKRIPDRIEDGSQSKKEHLSEFIMDYLGLGVIVYDKDKPIYCNPTTYSLQGFLRRSPETGEPTVPRNIEKFLQKFGENNNLRSSYLLNKDEENAVIRGNYKTDKHVYEIKMVHDTIDGERIDVIIVDDITQIKDQERRQRDLSANVSHELKTPLTVIKASKFFVESIKPDNIPSYDDLKRWGNRIIHNADRMQAIINEFMDLSMTDVSSRMSVCEFKKIVTDVYSDLEDYPNRQNIDINLDIRIKDSLVFGNKNLLERIVKNLLTNAIKYIEYDGKKIPNQINVNLYEVDDRISLQVNDNGRGIPEDSIDHLFERFYRVENSGSRRDGGTGIGLSIVEDITELHDGTINVLSKLGEGSTFTFSMPKARTVFDVCYEDSLSSVIREKDYYKSASDFIGVQLIEAVKSHKYDDMLELAINLEKTPFYDKILHEKLLIKLIASIGKARYEDLIEELLFISDFDEEFDDGIIEEEEEIMPPVSAEVQSIVEEPEEVFEGSSRMDLKLSMEEARQMLKQEVLPRHQVADTGNNNDNESLREKDDNKLYNKENFQNNSRGVTLNGNDDVTKSSLKRVLDNE